MANNLGVSIDRSSPVPLYHQVVQGIEAAIHSGVLEPGSRLDNEIDLAAQLNLSRPTMRKAMDELVRSGLLVRKRGVGTQVVSSQVRRPLELSSLFDDLTNNGKKPTTDVLTFSHVDADEATLATLQLPAGNYRIRVQKGAADVSAAVTITASGSSIASITVTIP